MVIQETEHPCTGLDPKGSSNKHVPSTISLFSPPVYAPTHYGSLPILLPRKNSSWLPWEPLPEEAQYWTKAIYLVLHCVLFGTDMLGNQGQEEPLYDCV